MKFSDLATLLLLAAVWGGSFLFMRIAAPVLGPIWLIEARVLLAGLALLPFIIPHGGLQAFRHHARPLLIVGLLNSALPFSLLAYASVVLPAGFTSILNATTPLFGIVVAAMVYHERMSRGRGLGFVLGFLGVLILVGASPFALTRSSGLAMTAGFAAPLMYAIAAPYAKRTLADVSPLVITAGSQLSAALFLLPLLPFTMPSSMPSTVVLTSVIALALLCTALAYILYFRLIRNIGSTNALTVTYLIPAFAMGWGVIFLGEVITLPMVLGCGLILLGTAIANR